MALFKVRNIFLGCSICSCIFLLLYLYLIDISYFQQEYLLLTILIVIAVFFMFFIKREKEEFLRRQHFKVSSFFLLGFFIVHFQFYIDLIFKYKTINSIYVINSSVLNKSAIVSALALCFFCLGYIYKSFYHTPKEEKLVKVATVKLDVVKVVLFFLFLGILITTPMKYFFAGYMSVERPLAAIVTQSYFVFVLSGYLILNTRNLIISEVSVANFYCYLKATGLLVVFVALLFCILTVMSGNRGPLISVILSMVGSYIFLKRKKYNILFVLFLIFIASSTLSFLTEVRHLESISSPLNAIQQVIYEKSSKQEKLSVLSTTEELARSVRTVHAAVDYTEKNGYSFGYYKILNIIGLVPGLGHILKPIIDIDSDAKSTNLLTKHIGADHGMGTSVVADVWIDFGLIGIIIVFFVFGVLLRIVDVKAYSHLSLNIFWYILIIVFLTGAIGLSRGVILDIVRDVIFTYVIVKLSIMLNQACIKIYKKI